jgi:hypothetical protein
MSDVPSTVESRLELFDTRFACCGTHATQADRAGPWHSPPDEACMQQKAVTRYTKSLFTGLFDVTSALF